jgi:hypothetical protein
METERPIKVEGSARWGTYLAWSGLSLTLFAWQAWLTLALFGGPAGWANLNSDEPISSGAHPQHLYLGALGAQGLKANGTTCVYDPAFSGGYPKTPIFDGSRLAEIFLYLAGETPPARAYKWGVAVICMMVPALFVISCWGAGVHVVTAALASSLGLLIWWGPHGRDAIEAGDCEMFLAALAVLGHICLLVRFDRQPGVMAWLGLVGTGALGVLAQPMLFPIVLPLLLIYYLTAGVRHPLLWHGALFAAEAIAVGVNFYWLPDWFTYWWLRSPFPSSSELLPHRTLATFWNAPLWGGFGYRLLALILLGSALIGVSIWNETRRRAAARLLGLGAFGLLLLALLGISWEPVGQMGTSIFFSPALWFAAIPAADAWVWIAVRLSRSTLGRLSLALTAAGIGAAGYLAQNELECIAHRAVDNQPLSFGLGARREELVSVLRQYTTADARILWEDRKLPRKAPRWSVLLPWLTDRYYMGGLDPAATIEHSSISFIDEALEGRHISLWTDKGLHDYCQRYNVSWIVAWTPAVIERLKAWTGATLQLPIRDDVEGVLFILQTPGPGYVTRGQAKIVAMNSQHIVLADVVPVDGEVILNLHYLAGLLAAPSRVAVEREPSGHDPIGFIRLKMTSPAPRLTLTWDRTR